MSALQRCTPCQRRKCDKYTVIFRKRCRVRYDAAISPTSRQTQHEAWQDHPEVTCNVSSVMLDLLPQCDVCRPCRVVRHKISNLMGVVVALQILL